MNVNISFNDQIQENEVVRLYQENKWACAKKPKQLLAALRNSHSLLTARLDEELVGLANAISDGHLIVYFPHVLILPNKQRQGIGRKIMNALLEKYLDYHQLMIIADGDSVNFYKQLGFSRVGKTEPLWIYNGKAH